MARRSIAAPRFGAAAVVIGARRFLFLMRLAALFRRLIACRGDVEAARWPLLIALSERQALTAPIGAVSLSPSSMITLAAAMADYLGLIRAVR